MRFTCMLEGIDEMIGFYILKASEPSGVIKGDMRKCVHGLTAVSNTGTVSRTFTLLNSIDL